MFVEMREGERQSLLGTFPLPQTATAARGLAALHVTRERLLPCGASGAPPPPKKSRNLPATL